MGLVDFFTDLLGGGKQEPAPRQRRKRQIAPGAVRVVDTSGAVRTLKIDRNPQYKDLKTRKKMVVVSKYPPYRVRIEGLTDFELVLVQDWRGIMSTVRNGVKQCEELKWFVYFEEFWNGYEALRAEEGSIITEARHKEIGRLVSRHNNKMQRQGVSTKNVAIPLQGIVKLKGVAKKKK